MRESIKCFEYKRLGAFCCIISHRQRYESFFNGARKKVLNLLNLLQQLDFQRFRDVDFWSAESGAPRRDKWGIQGSGKLVWRRKVFNRPEG